MITSFFSVEAEVAPKRGPIRGISLSHGSLFEVSSLSFETSPPIIMGVLFGTMAKVCTRLVDDPGLVATVTPSSFTATPSFAVTSAFTCTSISNATSFFRSETLGRICNIIPGVTSSKEYERVTTPVVPVLAVLMGNCDCSVISITAGRLFKVITLGRDSTSAEPFEISA